MGLIMIGRLGQVMEYVKTLVPEVEEFTDFRFGSSYQDPVYLLGELKEKPKAAGRKSCYNYPQKKELKRRLQAGRMIRRQI